MASQKVKTIEIHVLFEEKHCKSLPRRERADRTAPIVLSAQGNFITFAHVTVEMIQHGVQLIEGPRLQVLHPTLLSQLPPPLCGGTADVSA